MKEKLLGYSQAGKEGKQRDKEERERERGERAIEGREREKIKTNSFIAQIESLGFITKYYFLTFFLAMTILVGQR